MSSGAPFRLEDITPAHAEVLAAVHGEAFAEGWSVAAFASALAQPGAFGALAVEDGSDQPLGFALLRAALFAAEVNGGANGESGGGEAEVLTVATRPGARRRGVAGRVMAQALTQARELGVARVFLEVAENNAAALALYEGLGFAEVARRKGYYAGPANGSADTRVDAIVMALDLGA